jgi:large subunit ribosomal protein L21
MYAVVKNGGKQYRVQEGDFLFLDKISDVESGNEIELSVLAVSKEGELLLDGGSVKAEVVEEGRAKKVIIYKKRRRKDSKLKKGFRRTYTKVKITSISA